MAKGGAVTGKAKKPKPTPVAFADLADGAKFRFFQSGGLGIRVDRVTWQSPAGNRYRDYSLTSQKVLPGWPEPSKRSAALAGEIPTRRGTPPVTRAEWQRLVKLNDRDLAAALKVDKLPAGFREFAESRAYAPNPAKGGKRRTGSTTRRRKAHKPRANPSLAILGNPRGGIANRHKVTEIIYRHSDNGRMYSHKFRPAAIAYQLKNGNVLLTGENGQRLWNPYIVKDSE
jgi:hypothetical protein